MRHFYQFQDEVEVMLLSINFGHIRQTNAQPSIYECRQATARGSDIGPINNMFSVNSKSNTSGSDVYASESFSLKKSKANKGRKRKSAQNEKDILLYNLPL